MPERRSPYSPRNASMIDADFEDVKDDDDNVPGADQAGGDGSGTPESPVAPGEESKGGRFSKLFRRKKKGSQTPPEAGAPGGGDQTPGSENTEQIPPANAKSESVLGRMWRGEFVSEAEKKKATGWEKTALTTGKVADTLAYALGYKTVLRLADRRAKKNARGSEVRRIKEIIILERDLKERLKNAETPEEKALIQRDLNLLGVGEVEAERINEKFNERVEQEKVLNERLKSATTPAEKEAIQQEIDSLGFEKESPRYNRVRRKMETMRTEIEKSKYLSPEKKARLEEKLQALETKWITAEGDVDEQMAVEVDAVLNEHVGEKAKRMDYLKESVGLVGGAVSAYSFRAVATGAISLFERYRNLKGAKTEGQKVTVKELIWDGARDMVSELAGQGKTTKDLSYRDKRKWKGMGAAALKSLAPAMIVWLGYTEFADRGAGALTGAIPRIGERINEINRAWQSIDGPVDAIKAVLLTMNFEETFHRSTSLFRRGGHAPDAGHTEVLGKSTVSAGALTPDDTAALNRPHLEHSGAISTAEAGKIAHVAEIEPTPGPITAETLKYDALKTAGVQGEGVPDAHAQPSAPTEASIPKPSETVGAPREAVASSATDARAMGDSPEAVAKGAVDTGIKAGAAAADSNLTESPSATITDKPNVLQQPDATTAGAVNTPAPADALKANIPFASEESGSWMLDQQRIINLESSFGVDSADGITPEDVQKVAAQLQGANADSADQLLKSWQGTHPEIANSVQESRALVGLERALGVNSFEGQVSAEELKKVIAELAGENKADADKLLTAWESKGLVEHDAVLAGRFPIEHPSIDHAGFHAETADAKVDLALELGKEGAPQYLEQVFYRMALDDANIGGEITNLEGARILNVGANMTALLEGHDVAGVSSETFAKFVTVVDGKLEVTNFAGFHEEVLSKLTAHAEELITADNVGNTGAVTYLNNIKDETWADMAKPEGAEVNLDQTQIEQAEGQSFKVLVEDSGEHTGLGENITGIHATAEGDGSFEIAGETPVVIDHGAITSIGDTHFDQPIPLDSEAGHAKLLEEAGRIEAQRIGANILEDHDDDFIGDQSTETDLDDDSEILDDKSPDKAVAPENDKTNDTKPAESTDSTREIPRSSLNPIPKTEIPEGMTIKATPDADQFMRQNGLRIFHGQIIGEKLPHKIDFLPEPGQGADAGTTESMDFKMTQDGNLRVTITDMDGSKDIQEITSAGRIINIQGAEGPDTTPPAGGVGVESRTEQVQSALDRLNEKGVVDVKMNIEDIGKIDDKDLLEKMKQALEKTIADQEKNSIGTDLGVDRGDLVALSEVEDRLHELSLDDTTAGQSVEAISEGDRIGSVEVNGNKIEFVYDESGHVVDFKGEIKIVGDSNTGQLESMNVLRKDWLEVAQAHNPTMDEMDQMALRDQLSDAMMHYKVLEALDNSGQGDSPEARFLLDRIKDSMNDIKQGYGEVFKDSAVESSPIAGTESPTSPDAGTTAETAGDHIETVKTPDGNTARFTYDNSGNVTRVNVEGSTSGESGSLQDNFREQIKRAWEASGKKGDIQLNIDKVEMEAKTIDLHRSVLNAMQTAGQGNSPEAEFMRQQIERAIEHTEKTYGDVFKDSVVESTSVTGAESNIETPASPEDINKALNALVKGLRLSNMPPQVVEGMNITDIATINDSDFLQRMKMVTERVLNVVEKKTDTATEIKSLEAIIEAIDSRIGQLKA